VLAQFGPITLYTYTILIDLGLAVGLAALYWRAPVGRSARWLDAGLAAAVGGFFGARLVYVVAHGDFYFPNLDEIFQVWRGGLAWSGGVAGAALFAWLYSLRRREPLGPIVDALAWPIGLLGLLGWSGCLAGGCAYGYEVTPGQLPTLLTTTAPDLFGLSTLRLATQALGVVWSLVSLLLLWGVARSTARRWPAGALGAYALSLVALGVFALSFTRGDPAPTLGGFRLDTVGSALVLVSATAAWGLTVLRPSPPPAPSIATDADGATPSEAIPNP
jgi:phosphatidylglycerol:prolipoprotein diacylglycerol transferase